MRGSGHKVIAVLAVVAVLLSAALPAHAQYLCRMTGRVVSACCCPDRAARSRPESRALPADCCQRVTASARTFAPGTREALKRLAPPAVLLTVLVPVPLPRRDRARILTPAPARAPPSCGPPLFAKHCALLI